MRREQNEERERVNEPLTDHPSPFVAVPSLTEHAAVYHLCVLNLYIISMTVFLWSLFDAISFKFNLRSVL